MTVNKEISGKKLTANIVGRVDTTTAPALEAELAKSLDSIEELVLDFKELDYISSAGLRVILTLSKKMNSQGKMVVTNVKEEIMEIFEITGFVDILNIE